MCTIVLASRVFPGAPLALAANREEAVDRASEPPALRGVGRRRALAPRDAVAGGTWLGVNDAGLLVAVTNRVTDRDLPAGRSRGLLAADALAAGSVADAGRVVARALRGHDYAGFNLLLADAGEARLLSWDGTLASRALGPGVHVVVNDGTAGAGERALAVRARLWDVHADDAADWLAAAGDLLADHSVPVCRHGEGYGTVSSSLVAAGDGSPRWRFANGPPCRTRYAAVEATLTAASGDPDAAPLGPVDAAAGGRAGPDRN